MPQGIIFAAAKAVAGAALSIGVTTSAAVATAIGYTVSFIGVIGASMAASKLLAPKMPSFSDSSLSDRSQLVRNPISARTIVYGKCRVSGTIVYLSTTGTKNEYLHIVLTLAGHEVEAIDEVYFNDELVPLTGTSNTPDAGSFYNGVARINKKRGVPGDLADADLIYDTNNPPLANGRWTSDHTLSGIAYLYVRLTWDAEKFPSGIPNISAVIRGKKVLDPRTATTAYSANAALCLRDYLTDTSLGMGMTAAEVDDTAFGVAATICEEQVQILPLSPTVYENRYEANGVIVTSASPDENIGKLLSAMGGLIAYTGGRIVPYASAYRIPTVTLTEKHFVGPLNVQTRTSARDRVNSVKGVYVSETNNWQVTDFPTISSATYVTADNNNVFFRDVVLPFTTSPSCAQRLAVLELRRAREEITFSARFRLEAMQVRAGDTVMITNEKLGWSSKVFEVMEWNFASDGTPPQVFIDMTLRETASSVYSWTVSDEIAVPDSPNTTLPDPFTLGAPTNLALTADGTTQFLQADGAAIPRIKVAWTAPASEFIQSGGSVVIEYKPAASTTYLTWARVEGAQTEDFISSDVQIGTNYNVRIYGESYFGITTTYVSGSITVAASTTPPTAPASTSLSSDGVKPLLITGVFAFGVIAKWTANTEADFSHYEIKATITDSDAATDFSWAVNGVSNRLEIIYEAQCALYNLTNGVGYVRVRSVNRSGVASAFVRIGNANSSSNLGLNFGTATQTIAAGDDTRITGSAQKASNLSDVASPSAARANLGINRFSHVQSLTGGSPTETFTFTHSLGTTQNYVLASCVDPANDLLIAHDYAAAGNNSNDTVFQAATIDGSNISAGSRRFTIHFVQ